MKENALEEIWNTCRENETDADFALQLVKHESRRERRRRIRTTLFGFNLTATTIFAAWMLTAGRAEFSESWPATFMLATLWATFLEFARVRRADAKRFHAMRQDVRSTLEWAKRTTDATIREFRLLIGVNCLAVIPLTIVSVQFLLQSGKMTPQDSTNFALVCTVVFGGNIAFLAARYRRELVPRGRWLAERLDSLSD